MRLNAALLRIARLEDEVRAEALGTNYTTLVVGFAIKFQSLGGASNGFFKFNDGTTNQISFQTNNTTGQIDIKRNGTTIGSTSGGPGPYTVGVWYYFEAKVTFATGATGSVTVKINGQQVAALSSVQTAASGNAYANSIVMGNGSNVPFVDDLYLCDTTGTTNNDFLGDVRVKTLYPTGAGRVTQWAPTGAATDWQAVNNTNPDGDTSYASTSTAGNVDAYALGSAGTNTALKGVQVVTDTRKDDATTRTVAHGVGNGTTENFDAGTNISASYTMLIRTLDTNPLTSANWSTSDLSTLQGAVKCVA